MAKTEEKRRAAASGGASRNQPTFAGFAVRLLAYLFAISLLFSVGELYRHMLPLQSFLASTVTAGANLFGAGVQVRGPIIDVTELKLEINHECTAIFVLLVYVAFVFAYPAPWKSRLVGIGVGAFVLTGVNIGRLIVLTLIARSRPDLFNYVHEYFFQGVFIALLAVLASLWTEQVRRAAVVRLAG